MCFRGVFKTKKQVLHLDITSVNDRNLVIPTNTGTWSTWVWCHYIWDLRETELKIREFETIHPHQQTRQYHCTLKSASYCVCWHSTLIPISINIAIPKLKSDLCLFPILLLCLPVDHNHLLLNVINYLMLHYQFIP